MAFLEIGYIEQYCRKYHKTAQEDLYETVVRDGNNCWETCPVLSEYCYDCNKESERIKYKGFNLKNYDIYKNDDSMYEPDLLILKTNTRNYLCFYLKMDGHTLIDLRNDYTEREDME